MLTVPRPFPAARCAAITALLLAATAAGAAAQPHGSGWKPVRSTTKWGLELIEEGRRKSPSFRELIEELRESDLVIYVEPVRELPGVMVGVTEFLGTSGDFRYLRISVAERAARKRLISIIGHELQHAREIGGSRDIVDQASLASFYRRAGESSVDGFDTQAARDMGDTVYAELWRWRPQPGPETPRPVRPASGDRPVYLDLIRR